MQSVASNNGFASDGKRLAWSFLVSAIVNVVAWSAVAHLAPAQNVRQMPHERLLVATSAVRIERRPARTHRPKPRRVQAAASNEPAPAERSFVAEQGNAVITLPRGWTQAPQGFDVVKSATMFYDWTHATADFVPRTFLWQNPAPQTYMRPPGLHDAVAEVLDSLHAESAKIAVSKPMRVCRGNKSGWFFAYSEPDNDPPLHVDETVFLQGDTIYRATYIRRNNQPEDTRTRDALATLC